MSYHFQLGDYYSEQLLRKSVEMPKWISQVKAFKVGSLGLLFNKLEFIYQIIDQGEAWISMPYVFRQWKYVATTYGAQLFAFLSI